MSLLVSGVGNDLKTMVLFLCYCKSVPPFDHNSDTSDTLDHCYQYYSSELFGNHKNTFLSVVYPFKG